MDWDKKLRIKTAGLQDDHADVHHNRYEPTDYAVLNRLAESGHLGTENTLIDYGCGKGRVSLFLHAKLGCRTIGIEYDQSLVEQAKENQRTSRLIQGVEFVCARAETYTVTEGDCFYFFNPFSVEILSAVLRRLLESWYAEPRSMKLFFYYPDETYRTYLLSMDQLQLIEELDCSDLFPGNDIRERILVFELTP